MPQYCILGKKQTSRRYNPTKKATENVDFNHFSGVIPSYLDLEFHKALL